MATRLKRWLETAFEVSVGLTIYGLKTALETAPVWIALLGAIMPQQAERLATIVAALNLFFATGVQAHVAPEVASPARRGASVAGGAVSVASWGAATGALSLVDLDGAIGLLLDSLRPVAFPLLCLLPANWLLILLSGVVVWPQFRQEVRADLRGTLWITAMFALPPALVLLATRRIAG